MLPEPSCFRGRTDPKGRRSGQIQARARARRERIHARTARGHGETASPPPTEHPAKPAAWFRPKSHVQTMPEGFARRCASFSRIVSLNSTDLTAQSEVSQAATAHALPYIKSITLPLESDTDLVDASAILRRNAPLSSSRPGVASQARCRSLRVNLAGNRYNGNAPRATLSPSLATALCRMLPRTEQIPLANPTNPAVVASSPARHAIQRQDSPGDHSGVGA